MASDYERLAHKTNALLREAATDEAYVVAAQCLTCVYQEHSNTPVTVSLTTREAMDVAVDRHLKITKSLDGVLLEVPRGLVRGMFSNSLDSSLAIATLLNTFSVSKLISGTVIFDVEDGSTAGGYPRIAFCSSLPQATLVVDSHYIKHHGYAALKAQIEAAWIPWQDRSATVYWRGGTTGIQHRVPSNEDWNWRWLPRLNLCDVASSSRLAEHFDVGIVSIVQIADQTLRNTVLEAGFMRPRSSQIEFLQHQYVIDIDGNSNAWSGFFSAMLMGSCILKVTSPHGFKQWYYDRLIPGVHYIAVRSDLSNLTETVEWALSHPTECAEIGRRAKNFSMSVNYEDEVDLSGAKMAQLMTA